MPIIQKTQNVLASATIANVLSGEFFEFLPYNSLVEVGMNQSAIGLVIDFISGKDVVAKDYVPLNKATHPVYPDEFVLQDIAGAGERLTMSIRNTTAGALDLRYCVRISPV